MSRSSGWVVSALATLGAAAAGALHAAPCTPNVFRLPGTSPATALIRDLATGDFDGDGIPDLAVATGDGANGIYVLLGRADGTFSAPQEFAGGANTASVVTGEFDANDTLDAIGGPYLEFFAGNGDGTFQPAVNLNGISLGSIVAADVDGDGKLDLAGLDNTGYEVLLGNGDGTFQDPIVAATPFAFPAALAVGDVVGDASLDLVVTGGSAPGVVVYPGHGDGTFDAPIAVGASTSSDMVALADFDGDGDLDIAVHDSSVPPSGAIAVYLNQGGGVFSPPVLLPALSVWRLVAADLDHDGHPDLIVAGYGQDGPGVVRLFFGRGDGTFDPPVDFLGGDQSDPTVATDPTGAGLPNLVFPTAGERTISIMGNRGGRVFGGAPVTPFSFTSAFTSGDFDEDSLPDVATTISPDFQHPDFFVSKGDGSGRFAPLSEAELNQQIYGLQTGRFSNSGHLDLVAQSSFGVSILPGNGDGTFGSPVGTPFYSGAPSVADLNGDGLDDLVGFVQGQNGPEVASQITGGAFTQIPLPGFAGAVAAGSLDGDAFPDLVVTLAEEVAFLKGNGDGSFTPNVSYPAEGTTAIAFGDVNGDGHRDVAVLRPEAGTFLLFLGRGDGTFDVRQIGVGWKPTALTLADFDGDGLDDVLTVNSESGNAALLISLGAGRFRAPVPIPAGQAVSFVESSDLNGDGRLDALVASGIGVVALINEPLSASATGASAIFGQAAAMHATATGIGLLTYQWRKGETPLDDGGSISGSHTATLAIDPVSFADAGSYDVVVTDSCGNVTSNPTTLSVEFADVPTSSPFHDDILSIATAGITGGCGGGNYCPTSAVRRDQMAVFLLKSEHGSGYTPPACAGVFADVPCPSAFADWVEQLAAEGVTSGCGGGDYCPDQSVTRAQMAVFLLKTSQGSSYTPPAATGIFGDVPVGSFAADFIEDLYNRGITGGCQASPLLYCPGNIVLRQQMATFLVRTFF